MLSMIDRNISLTRQAGTKQAVNLTRRRGDAERRTQRKRKKVNTQERGDSGERWADATRVSAELGACGRGSDGGGAIRYNLDI
jgi:hypothetical protein